MFVNIIHTYIHVLKQNDQLYFVHYYELQYSILKLGKYFYIILHIHMYHIYKGFRGIPINITPYKITLTCAVFPYVFTDVRINSELGKKIAESFNEQPENLSSRILRQRF